MHITLVLGSGGPRGYAHIGVINELKDRGHEVVAISGCSMGAVIGGLEAAGALGEFEEWARSLTTRDVVRLMDVTLKGPGVIKADRVIGRVAQMLGDVLIENLPIPYTAVATDLEARREVWFQRGPLDRAIRASIAIPGMITPAVVNGRVLVDGGVLNPVPLEPVAAVPADRVVAVSLSGRPIPKEGASPVIESSAGSGAGMFSWIKDGLGNLLPQEAGRSLLARAADDDDAPARLRTPEILAQSLEAMESMIERFRSAARPADVTVRIPIDVCGQWDYHRAEEVIEVGRALAGEAFDAAGL